MPNCANCKLDIGQNEVTYDCDSCKQPIHEKGCSRLTASEIKCMQLRSSRVLKLFCKSCEMGIQQIPAIIETLQALRKDIEELKLSQFSKPTNTQQNESFSMSEIIAEISEREVRKKHVMLFGLPESEGNGNEDKKNTLKIMKTINQNVNENNFKLYRTGRLLEGSQRPRPIKIIFNTQEEANRIIRNTKILKQQASFKDIFVTTDKTPLQMKQYKDLKNQLTERTQNGETNLRIKYVNGEPKITKNL